MFLILHMHKHVMHTQSVSALVTNQQDFSLFFRLPEFRVRKYLDKLTVQLLLFQFVLLSLILSAGLMVLVSSWSHVVYDRFTFYVHAVMVKSNNRLYHSQCYLIISLIYFYGF